MTLTALVIWLSIGVVAGVVVGRAARKQADKRKTPLGRARSVMMKGARRFGGWFGRRVGGALGGSSSDDDADDE